LSIAIPVEVAVTLGQQVLRLGIGADLLAAVPATTTEIPGSDDAPDVDKLLQQRFVALTRLAIAGELDAWDAEPTGALALVLMLDQFPRQIWRDSAMAFAGDPKALTLSLRAVELGWLEVEQERPRQQFWLMPLMHSEDLAVQEAALPLFDQFTDSRTVDVASRHRDVIARFQRFPHRNAALGRVSSAAELAFLQQPGSPLQTTSNRSTLQRW
jgi:uncharacterized protein (DUF924 family)